MGTAADDLRDREEQLWEEHLLKQCISEDCPYCQRETNKGKQN